MNKLVKYFPTTTEAEGSPSLRYTAITGKKKKNKQTKNTPALSNSETSVCLLPCYFQWQQLL